VMEIMPKTAVGYAEYKKTYLEMIKALLPLQRPDGFWNVSLHDATHFGGKEASGTSLFIYGMAWGVRHGWLDKKIYMPVIAKAWKALVKESVHPDGMLGYVQGTGKEPKDGQPVTYDKIPDFEDYGLGCFLLAGSEVYKLAK
jgi:unsaturated rhamnogalacturonyl hydrolase